MKLAPLSARSSLNRTLQPGLQRVGPLIEIPQLLRELGMRPSKVLRRAGMAADALSRADARLSYLAVGQLLHACAEMTRRPDFGLLLAARWRLAHIGPVGELLACSATVKQALQCFASFQWMNASGGSVFLQERDKLTSFGYAIYEPGMHEGLPQAYDYTMGIGVQLMRELTGSPKWTPALVEIARPKPADVGPYAEFFKTRVRFSAPNSEILYPSRFNATRVPTRNDVRWRELQQSMSARREMVLQQIYRMVRIGMIFDLSVGDLAKSMFISRRTLNRRLSDNGTSYRKIEQQVRYDVAAQLLRDASLPVAEIAQALGYAEASVFVRAFRRWSGVAPEKWRKSNSGTAGELPNPDRP